MPAWQDYELWLRFASKLGRLKNTHHYDYVWDLSHDHERISKSLDRIERAFQLMSYKHESLYRKADKKYLYFNLLCYPEFKLKLSNIYTTFMSIGFFLTLSRNVSLQ